ncbi:hypothetical protein [Saccharopolyspora griseoalba]|uniref:Uncharacterized protein n=1 Tax=Saccharopolyspora griseoalba TaxID=1431848 RepID=A0ABW2LKS5_9PSEU
MLTTDQKTQIRVLSVMLAVACAVLGLVYGWPLWLWIALVVVLLLAPSLIAYGVVEWNLRKRQPNPQVQEEWEPPWEEPVPAAPEPARYSVDSVLVRSAHEDYRFSFSCTVLWRSMPNAPGLPHPNPGVLGADLIVAEATKLAASVEPGDASSARYRMMNALGMPRKDPSGRVEVWADDIELALSEDDTKRLARLAKVRKDEEVWDYERRYELNVRNYLRGDVLSDEANAVVWWLAGPRTDEKQRVDEAVAKLENLRLLARAANTTESGGVWELAAGNATSAGVVPAPQEMYVPAWSNGQGEAVPESSLSDSAAGVIRVVADGPEQAMFARQMADLLDAQGRSDVAQEMRDRFDAPHSQESDAPVNGTLAISGRASGPDLGDTAPGTTGAEGESAAAEEISVDGEETRTSAEETEEARGPE